MSERIRKVNELIKRELSQIILREIDFSKGVLVTITRVEASPNLIQAKVYISALPEDQLTNVFHILKQRVYNIQQLLNKRLKMRPMPKIEIMEEKETKQAGRIEEILEKIKKQ
ncbi:30S ribosome-binding factor RbfA [Candidatus Parcubacteria bacterium]|nr:30S ribosome-binding factor RbfA [Candidatus Parcubacteria bacterium]